MISYERAGIELACVGGNVKDNNETALLRAQKADLHFVFPYIINNKIANISIIGVIWDLKASLL